VSVMSEDAPVNTGAAGSAAWPSESGARTAVRRIQGKLHCWALADGERRFDDLFNLVCDPAVLRVAWLRVAGNKGAHTPGVDGSTVTRIVSQVGVDAFLHEVRTQLKARTFTPTPVRQVMIAKASGKLRALGIPTVTDRVVQAALKLVLEPIFEADFQPVSYGFRPNRRAQDAIAEIHHYATNSYRWVLEADIEACFDTIEHAALMDRLRDRISDKRVLGLVKSFLKAGVMTTIGTTEGTITGTPQGGILSPLLANIALSVLDEHFMQQWTTTMASEVQRQKRRRHGLANYRLVRYADDFVILVTGEKEHAEALRAQVADVLAPMGLRLSAEKTRVAHVDDGFDFLGFTIRRMRKRGSHKFFIYTVPSRKAIASIRTRVRAMTYRATLHRDPGYLLDYLGRVLRGWANYFRHGVSKRIFNAIDSYTWERITHWLRQKHRIGWPEMRRRYCLPGTWRLAYDGQRFRGAASVTVTRYRYRGYRIPTPWTPSTTTL
jgi:RNA-directed DNA polymerase